jgi:hypothetical protein
MNFLEGIGLTTLIFGGIYFLSEFLEKQKEYESKLALEKREGERSDAKWKEQQDSIAKLKDEKKLKEFEILQKQIDFYEKWKKIDPEEEYLIRIGKIKSLIFNPEIYNGFPLVLPWGSAVEREKNSKNTNKATPKRFKICP